MEKVQFGQLTFIRVEAGNGITASNLGERLKGKLKRGRAAYTARQAPAHVLQLELGHAQADLLQRTISKIVMDRMAYKIKSNPIVFIT